MKKKGRGRTLCQRGRPTKRKTQAMNMMTTCRPAPGDPLLASTTHRVGHRVMARATVIEARHARCSGGGYYATLSAWQAKGAEQAEARP